MSTTRIEKRDFARQMIGKLETALATGAGVVSVSTDGVSTTYDRKGALAELEYWRKQDIRYSRSKSRTTNIDLSGAHD